MSDVLEFLGKTVQVIVDRPMNSKHPDFKMNYPVNYGYIPNTISSDGDEIDAYILGVNEPVESFIGKCIAVIQRHGDEDKLVIAPKEDLFFKDEIKEITHFLEKYFESTIRMNRARAYFSNTIFEIISITIYGTHVRCDTANIPSNCDRIPSWNSTTSLLQNKKH